MKIVIIGGHLSPALAVIEELKEKNEILFIGRINTFEGDEARSLEYEMMRRLHIPFVSISTGRLQRKLTRYTLLSLLKLPIGFFNALLLLKSFKPHIILGFGGYLQIPVVFASFFLNIPVVIHEQTQEAGLANRICSFFARKICISWETSSKFFPKEKTILTGNPIRKIFIEHKLRRSSRKIEQNTLPLLYITGGSSGSHFINTLVEECLAELLRNFKIIHQTGDAKKYNDFNRLTALKKKLNKKLRVNYKIKKFISDEKELLKVYEEACLIISRAGINTVSELIYFEKPSVLIPIPFSQKNEQKKNAEFLQKLGLCEILDQEETSPKEFLQTLLKMKSNIARYKIKNSFYKKRLAENAAGEIIRILENEAKKK